MKNVIVAGVAALALVGCGKKEEAVPAPEAVLPACAEGQVESVNDAGEHVCADAPAAEAAPEVVGGPTGSAPAQEPTVEVPAAK